MQSVPGSVALADPVGDVVPLQTSSNTSYPVADSSGCSAVTPRQTIRIVARESSTGTSPTGELLGFFPAVLLPLK